MARLLGMKGANLAAMCRIGLPVPPGFTISTELTHAYQAHEDRFPPDFLDQLQRAVQWLEQETGTTFGGGERPLLVSVRSGAPVSMPGMMDTVLNLGVNDRTVRGLAHHARDPRFAFDCYRRFMQMYGEIVLGCSPRSFEAALRKTRERTHAPRDAAIPAEALQELVGTYRNLIEDETHQAFPTDPLTQLLNAIQAVMKSWNTSRAATYRSLYDIPNTLGTAVTVQAMVFGNMGEKSLSGVAFTRDPVTGANEMFGEYLPNAQGEDVVAGIRTPFALTDPQRGLAQLMPEVWEELLGIRQKLEHAYRAVQDIEFTVQEGRLYILQTRNGKCSARASLRCAVDMCREGLIDQETALLRIDPHAVDQVLYATIAPGEKKELLGRGLAASPGAVTGQIVFEPEEAVRRAQAGQAVLLVREETSAEDIQGMQAARGIVTARGGVTSHAAVVARGMGRPCVCGVGTLRFHREEKTCVLGGVPLAEGDWLTISGQEGAIYRGCLKTIPPEMPDSLKTILAWANAKRRLRVRANAETLSDVRQAQKFGAEGIGLCRTEHMFFEKERLPLMRGMILADSPRVRQKFLDLLRPMQQNDFEAIFRLMAPLPITVRLLDPPLHEFLSVRPEDLHEIARVAGQNTSEVARRIHEMRESNPMLGHRGCRLMVTSPEIYEMQVRALLEAISVVQNQEQTPVACEIMLPLVATAEEIRLGRDLIRATAQKMETEGTKLPPFEIGAMIELPRAALCADELAPYCDFFSFGTNDLTQTVWGLSRDDSQTFLGAYSQKKIVFSNPFRSLDAGGVGQLMSLALQKVRTGSTTGATGSDQTRLKFGVCGEHGGDPDSIGQFETMKLDYVSCAPFRVPVACLAAAQEAIRQKKR